MSLVDLVEKKDSQNGHCLCCGDSLSSDVRVCPDCGTPSHGDCWDYVGGCGLMGCSKRGTNLDKKALSQDGSLVVMDDVSIPSAPKPVRNYDGWLARLRSWLSREDKDAWIDSYLDEVRSSLKGVRFIELSDYVSPSGAIEFCEKQGAVLASAQECAFFSILNDLKDRGLRRYTSTFSFGFKDDGKPVVAYAEVPHKDWLYLMRNFPNNISRDDPVVSSALARAVDEGRVVPAKSQAYSLYSCVPVDDRSSNFDQDDNHRAIFLRAAQPWGLLRHRKGLSIDSYLVSSREIEALPKGQVIPRFVGLGGIDDVGIGISGVVAGGGYVDSGRARAGSVVAKIC